MAAGCAPEPCQALAGAIAGSIRPARTLSKQPLQ
jgi:hypothetical protein